MPRTLLLCVLTISAACVLAPHDSAAQTIYDTSRAVEMAQLRLRLYERVEYPATLRQLEAELKLAEAEAQSLRRLLDEYGPFDKFSTGRPLVLTIEATRLGLLRAELKRDNLREELRATKRWHADRLRLLQLEVEQAAAAR